jgi:aryl-alcohol dehydrogenase-like predicted oxidoreductase
MKYRKLGNTGIQVSSLCFGTMSFGKEADEKTSIEMFNRCREVGINCFDTANVYSLGKSEEILGKCIANCRDEVIITSKVGNPTGQDINAQGLSRRNITLSVNASLKRLKTDRIDIYFVHKFDQLTEIEDTLLALNDLRKSGKILYLGVSNWAAWQIMKALGISDKEGIARFECIQPMYNLAKRQAEVEILPLALNEKMGVFTYSPLGGGLLTGKYGKDKKPKEGRILTEKMYISRYKDKIYYEIAEKFTEYAHAKGYNPVTLAVAWVMSHPAVTAPIIGARDVAQLESSLAAAEFDMIPKFRREISSLSLTPPLATDRSEEADLDYLKNTT